MSLELREDTLRGSGGWLTAPSSRFLRNMVLAIASPRLRLTNLALLGLPSFVLYIYSAIVSPILYGLPFDFATYLKASVLVAGGGNPYTLPGDPNVPAVLAGTYIYPPFWAWFLQPLVHMDSTMQVALFIIFGQLCMAVFIWTVVRTLEVRSLQSVLLIAIAILGFQPLVGGYLIGQVSIVLLPLAGLWLLSWGRNQGWGHFALGIAIGIKVIQAPVLLLTVVWRRFTWLALAAAGLLVTALVATPWLFPQYLSEVFPALRSTSDIRNQSLAGILTRALHPGTFWPTPEMDRSYIDVSISTMLVSLAVVGITAWVLWRMPTDRHGRLYGAALVSTLAPLLAPVVWGDHQVFLIIPILVLGYYAIIEHRRKTLILAIAAWIMIGVGIPAATAMLLSGTYNVALVETMVALAPAANILLWGIALFECRRITNIPVSQEQTALNESVSP